MSVRKDIGQLGENLAQKYLIEQGYAILQTNWRIGRVEADIIAYHEGLIVFVEVKTRTSDAIAAPEEAVTPQKQKSYFRLANAYVLQNRREEEVRFDIVSVLVKSLDNIEIRHIPNAFTTVG